MIQTFDPPGVGATDLRECPLLQLERAGQQETLEYRIIRDFMEALGKRRIPGNCARHRPTMWTRCRTWLADNRPPWNRVPDAPFCRTPTNTSLPEVFVRKVGDDFAVTTNDETFRTFASATFTRT